MYHSQTKLQHLLSTSDYWCERNYHREISELLKTTWHLVGTTAELSRPGDFITCIVADTSLQIRNFGGQLRALSNICAHRHAELCSLPSGHAPTMRCQYHGWEYQADGRTGKIPEPKNFVPLDRDALRLPSYALETLGQLVFVNVSPHPQPLREFLGDEFHSRLAERFSDDWVLSLVWQPKYAANWKVPVENSLEAYHVPAVHPHTFREDPGPDRSQHGLLPQRTWFATDLPFSPHNRLDATFQYFESHFVRWLGCKATGRYEQHHVFPNLLFSFTDAISLCQCVQPTSAECSRATVRQFGRLPQRLGHARPRLRSALARGWSRLTAAITRRVLEEDLRLFPAIQAGLRRSPHAGVIGRCEERIYGFQQYLLDRLPRESGVGEDV